MSKEERRRRRQEREEAEHLAEVTDVLQKFKDLFLRGGAGTGIFPYVLRDRSRVPEKYIGLVAFLLTPESQTTPKDRKTMSELEELQSTESGRQVLVDAYERFEAWRNYEEGDDDD